MDHKVLVVHRHAGESVLLRVRDVDIVVEVHRVSPVQIALAFIAPAEVEIRRGDKDERVCSIIDDMKASVERRLAARRASA